MSLLRPRTTLSAARGQSRNVISEAQRRDEMQPLGHVDIDGKRSDRIAQALRVAEFKLNNYLLDEAVGAIKEALAMALRVQFVTVFGKPASPIFDPDRILDKLRSRGVISRDEFKQLTRLCEAEITSFWEVELFLGCVARLAL